MSAGAVIIGGMPEHRWAPPSHTDPPEDHPLGIEAPPAPDRVTGYPAVWVRVEFTRSGPQTCPGFVEQADGDVVYVQLVHMGFVHHVWVEAKAIAATADAVLIEWGSGQAATAAWVWRAAVKHRADRTAAS